MIRILVADDHQLIADGIRSLLAEQHGFAPIACVSNGLLALTELASATYDVVLMDINMPVMGGVEATKRIKAEFPDVKVIALSMHDDVNHLNMMMDAGASGYLLKSVSTEELLLAINKVLKGEKYLSSDVTQQFISTSVTAPEFESAHVPLSEREMEIVKLIAQGISVSDIAGRLFISVRTVETHRANVLKKLGLKNTAALIRYAFQQGLT